MLHNVQNNEYVHKLCTNNIHRMCICTCTYKGHFILITFARTFDVHCTYNALQMYIHSISSIYQCIYIEYIMYIYKCFVGNETDNTKGPNSSTTSA